MEEEHRSPRGSNGTYAGSAPNGLLPLEEIALLYINIALIHGYLGSYYLSAAAFEEALLLDEVSAIAWFGLGIAKFYLRELGASKRAFAKCLGCFITWYEDGERRQNQVLTYKVWAGHSTSRHSLAPGVSNSDSNVVSGPWQPFKNVLNRKFPDGRWTLESPRVEWNWRIALFERNHVRKGVPRPAGGKWGMNGIPAGVIFGPTPHLAIENATRDRAVPYGPISQRINLSIKRSPEPDGEAKSRTVDSVKQKWSLLQQRIRGKKTSSVTPPSSPRPTNSSESAMSLSRSDNQPKNAEGNTSVEKATPGRISGHLPSVFGISLPFTLPKSKSRATSAYEERSEERSIGSGASIGGQASQDAVAMFPRRRSSLTPVSARIPYGRSRSSRDSMFSSNYAMGKFESIQEEAVEGEYEYLGSINIQTVIDDFNDDDDHMLEDVSPKDMRGLPSARHTIPKAAATTEMFGRPEGVMITDSRLYSNTISTIPILTIPQTAARSRFGSDSFMTDSISPLSPQTRSAMFPRLSDAQSPSSCRPSYAANVWNADPDEHDDGGRRGSSAIITLTPATPERASPVSLFGKKERMSITGCTCLGEWEWEDAYERWRQEESVDMDDDDVDTGEEMLQPKCFEGFDTGR